MIGIDVGVTGRISDQVQQATDRLAEQITAGVERATDRLKGALREQVIGAGLGQRLANTWRGRVFKNAGLNAAGVVSTTAPQIIGAFDQGVTIVARNGSRWLAIPTDAVPRRWGGGRMSPVDVEAQFNRDLRLVPSRNRQAALLVLDKVVPGRSGRGLRPATTQRQAQGRRPVSVIMFVLVPQVTLAKRLDVAGVVARVRGEFPTLAFTTQTTT